MKAGWVAMAAVIAAAPGLGADAKGQVRLSRASFTVADAVAYKTDDGIEVALLSAAFDRKAAVKDQKIDSFDLMGSDGQSITLRIGSDGSMNCIDFRTDGGGGSSCNSDYEKALTLTTRTADRVAGSFKLTREGESADVTFDLKVESTVTRPGTPLPAGGGEPGKAALAYFAAVEKGDFRALKALARPEQRAKMEEAEKSGEAKEMFEFLREMSPRKVKIVGGTIDGDEAFVDFEGVSDGEPAKGVVELVRVAGQWYVSGTSSH
jgi:Domain of unknown function (DUF4878)